MTEAIKKEPANNSENDVQIRQRFVRRARVVTIVALALAWMVELGGDALSAQQIGERSTFLRDSLNWDLQTGGTPIGGYPSSRVDIISRWSKVVKDDEDQSIKEIVQRLCNWLALLLCTGGAGYLFLVPKGKVLVEDYIENGVQCQG